MNGNGILIIDFGGGHALSVANKLRGERVYCEILPFSADHYEMREAEIKGIVLVGGAEDAFLEDAPAVPQSIYEFQVPVLGVGYGARAMAKSLGSQRVSERLEKHTGRITFEKSPLFEEMVLIERFFERIDLLENPEGIDVIAHDEEGQPVAFQEAERNLYGIQFYPERNDPDGIQILNNFARKICGCEPWWNMETYIEQAIEEIRRQVGEGEALLSVSGGIDSTVAALLMNRAIGKRAHCVHINTGLLRKGETEYIQEVLSGTFGIFVTRVDASERILGRLSGVSDPRRKKEIITEELVSAFAAAASTLTEGDSIVQGTIYNDVLAVDQPDDVAIRTRKILGSQMNITKFVEPVRALFKYEVRQVGVILGLSPENVHRQQFPVAGLALRCTGAVTEEKLWTLREADAIFREELSRADLEKRIGQSFAVLTDMGGEYGVALRALNIWGEGGASAYRLPYELLERVVSRITAEVPGIRRVLYDLSANPPAPVEWE